MELNIKLALPFLGAFINTCQRPSCHFPFAIKLLCVFILPFNIMLLGAIFGSILPAFQYQVIVFCLKNLMAKASEDILNFSS